MIRTRRGGISGLVRSAGQTVVLMALFSMGCSPEAADHTRNLDDLITWVGGVALEESDDVVNVRISVHGSATEGYVVADVDEKQVRLYDADGKLRLHFGGEGDGPGEFASAPMGAVELHDESILAIDLQGRILRYLGPDSIETVETQLGPVHDLAAVSPSHVVFAGQRGQDPERLHLYNISERRVEMSFFRPGIPDRLTAASRTAGIVSVDVRHDTMAAVFALTDTLYLFDTDGTLLTKTPIPSEHYRQIEQGPEGYSSPGEWLGDFSMYGDVFHTPDGSFVIQYQDREDMQPVWRLLRMTGDGALLFEALATPRLLTVMADTLVFLDPRSLTPDKWSYGQLGEH